MILWAQDNNILEIPWENPKVKLSFSNTNKSQRLDSIDLTQIGFKS